MSTSSHDLASNIRTVNAGTLKVGGAVISGLAACLLMLVNNIPWNWFLSIALSAIAGGFVVLKRGTDFDLLHPVRVFGALWFACLSLSSMRLLPIISDWNFLMWAYVVIGVASFIAGFALARSIWREKAANLGSAMPRTFQSICLPNTKTLVLAAVCIALGTSVLAYEFHLIGGIPLFADNIDQMRMELFGTAGTGDPTFDTMFVKTIHFFVDFLKYGVFLAFIVLVQRQDKSWRLRVIATFLVLAGSLVYVSQAGRMFLIEILVTCTVFFHYLRRRIRIVELVLSVLIVFILLGVAGSLRTQTGVTGTVVDQVRSGSGFPEGRFWDGIGFGYLTLTESFEVFYRLTIDLRTSSRPPQGFLFYGFHRIVPRANIQEFLLNLYSGLFVTPTYMGELYADFGVAGILLGSLALGILYGWVYLHVEGPNVIFWVFVRGMFVQMIFFFPYVNLFSQYLNWIVDPIFMYLLIRFLQLEDVTFLGKGTQANVPVESE